MRLPPQVLYYYIKYFYNLNKLVLKIKINIFNIFDFEIFII